MERKISLADLQKTVDEAYEQYKSLNDGEIDARVKHADPKSFGIAVVLTDGTVVKKADTDVRFALGDIAKVPVSTVLATQNSAEEIVKKSGTCCRCAGKPEGVKATKLPVNKHALRAVSAIAVS
ncbi:MAG: glutaminase [Muribaculaceae bacterium]|nr:glutaminase [Muribaculaceae bacterium]